MISYEFALSQLNRLAGHKGFELLAKDGNEELCKDYVHAIQAADTEQICVRVMDDIVASPIRELPTAAYIRRAMNDENDRHKPDPTLETLAQWEREAKAEREQWKADPAVPPPEWIQAPTPDPKGYEKILEPILAQYRAGAWRHDPEGARHAALMQMWLAVNRGQRMVMTEPGKMPAHLWEELLALQAQFTNQREEQEELERKRKRGRAG